MAYCLMPNHVHMVAVPQTADGLRRAIGEAHRRYTRYINFREDWRGHLWQGRFASFPMDNRYLMAAARYIELNPVRAKLCRKPWCWPWSSAAAHMKGEDDILVKARPLLKRVDDWESFLAGGLDQAQAEVFRMHEKTGRPLGNKRFIKRLESELGRIFRRQKPGPKLGKKRKTKAK